MNKIFDGVCTALVTPFKDNAVDFTALDKLIEIQIAAKIDALLILGTTGEPSTLSLDEKKQIIAHATKTVKNRIPLIIGIGGNNPTAIIKLGLHAREYKPAGVLVTAPYYNKATQDGVVQYFQTIADAVKLPIIVYNIPGRTGMNIEPETFAKLSKIKYICGIKEASGNITQIADVIRQCPKIAVYCGDDALALPSYAIGACGVISVASNATPKEVREIYTLFNRKKVEASQKNFMQQLPFYKNIFCEVNPIPIKYVLAKTGLIQNELRLPLTPLSSDKQKLFD